MGLSLYRSSLKHNRAFHSNGKGHFHMNRVFGCLFDDDAAFRKIRRVAKTCHHHLYFPPLLLLVALVWKDTLGVTR